MAGLYTTRVTAWKQTEADEPRVGLTRSAAEQMKNFDLVNDAIASIRTAFAAQDSLTSIATHLTTTSGGNYTLTVTIPSIDGGGTAVAYTTASIAHNATGATIEAALDTASPATVTDGDIAVVEAGSAGLSDGACTFTCSGTVASMPVFITIADVDLSGSGNGVGAVTQTTYGQAAQVSKQALYDMNVVAGTRNEVGSAPTWTRPAANGQSRPRKALIRALCADCSAVDGSNEVFTEVLRLYPGIKNA